MDNEIKQINLLELLKNNVQIPILQRDYAHGRNKQSLVRDSFLDAIDLFLSSDNKNLNLDFIYGYYDNEKTFLPIDGQQRITTVWLLYIYFKSKANDNSEQLEKLSNFTYATRDDADEFCKKLFEFKFNNEQIPSKALKNNIVINGIIINSDPTVLSMLRMLDSIHDKFKDVDVQKYLKKLDNITFHLIDMAEFNLGEELYIKMNARGKQLDSFDNFKSWIQEDKNIRNDHHLVAQIDNDWIDFFWKKENEKESWNTNIMRFIYNIAIYFYLDSGDKSVDKFINKNLNENSQILNKIILQLGNKNIFSRERLIEVDKVITFIKKQELLLYANQPMEVRELAKFFVIVAYVLSSENDEELTTTEAFADWQAVFNHIIPNIRSRDNEEYIRYFFSLLKDLQPGCKNIYKFLAEKGSSIKSGPAKDRVAEEIIKAKLISADGRGSDWERAINKIQNHKYFQGWIDFLLTYSNPDNKTGDNILEYYNLELFQKYSEIVANLFEPENLEKNLKNMQRALLSFDDYSIMYQNWFLGASMLDLQKGREPWYKFFKQDETKELFDTLADDHYPLNTTDEIGESLNKISEENLLKHDCWEFDNDWWRYLIVKYPETLDVCSYNRFKRTVDGVHLLDGIKPYTTGYHLLCYGFYKHLKRNKRYKPTEYTPILNDQCKFAVNELEVSCNIFTITITDKNGKTESLDFELYKSLEKYYKDLTKLIQPRSV